MNRRQGQDNFTAIASLAILAKTLRIFAIKKGSNRKVREDFAKNAKWNLGES